MLGEVIQTSGILPIARWMPLVVRKSLPCESAPPLPPLTGIVLASLPSTYTLLLSVLRLTFAMCEAPILNERVKSFTPYMFLAARTPDMCATSATEVWAGQYDLVRKMACWAVI